MTSLHRRELFRAGLHAAAAYALVPRTLQRPGSVVVIGAGLAGLAAAYELMRGGHEVTILEARSYAGGRVRTIREPFAHGLFAESGAVFIPGQHAHTMRYVRRFTLPLDPIAAPPGLATIYELRGRRVVAREGARVEWPLNLSATEQAWGPDGLREHYLDPLLPELGDPTAPGWPPARLRRYDGLSLGALLRERGASADAVTLLSMAYLDYDGEGVESYSALSGLRDLLLGHGEPEYRIRGGNDRLPASFAARLGGRIRYGAAADRIDHDERGVRVVYQQGGVRQERLRPRESSRAPALAAHTSRPR